jgi:hypothetical protein
MNPEYQVLSTSPNSQERAVRCMVGGYGRGGDTATLCNVTVAVLTVSRPGFRMEKRMQEDRI